MTTVEVDGLTLFVAVHESMFTIDES